MKLPRKMKVLSTGLQDNMISDHIAAFFTEMGLDLSDPNLKDTPKRIARMWMNDFCQNVGKEFENFTVFPNTDKYNQMITSESMEFSSVCSHHFVPFSGICWLGYIPDQYIIGKSKISRLVDFYSKKPQIQEGLTHEILNCFVENVKPLGCMVIMKAVHSCEHCRGARKHAPMATSAIYGNFDQATTRMEFLELIKLNHTK